MAVRGLNRTETCIVHHDRPAAARCGNCHKPLCAACVVSTDEGKFCSDDCATKTANYRTRNKAAKPVGGGAGGLIRAILLVAIVIVVLALLNKYAFHIPVIGPLLEQIPVIGARAPVAP